MKKFFLAIAAVGIVSLASCKSEEKKVEDATKDVTEQAVETGMDNAETATDIAVASSDMPTFSNPEVQKFAEEYQAYYNQLMEAANSGDATKLQELTAQGIEWSKKASEWTQKMTAEDSQKWIDWSSKLQDAASKR
jgi:2-phospho-L-lactate guanylyltransferase (CobY/MobA/RfbA family)